jgi:hypothetical protein
MPTDTPRTLAELMAACEWESPHCLRARSETRIALRELLAVLAAVVAEGRPPTAVAEAVAAALAKLGVTP